MSDLADDPRLTEALVSRRCGLITEMTPQPRALEEPTPPYLWNATLTHYNFLNLSLAMRLTGGKGLTESHARLAALGEAIERYSAFHWDNGRVRVGPVSEHAITPPECVLYSDAQYASGTPFRPWSPEQNVSWISGTELPSGTPVEIPAPLVYLINTNRAEDQLAATTSNGLAAGRDLTHAILGGLHEVIERDAFMITWLNRLPATMIRAPQKGCHAAQIIRHYARFGVTVRLLSLATDQAATVVMALAQDPSPDGAFHLIGLGCDLNPAAAVDKAVFELCQQRAGIGIRMRAGDYRARLTGPEAVRTLDDHLLYHAIPEHAHEIDFLFDGAEECELGDLAVPDTDGPEAELDLIVSHATQAGARVAYSDITAPDIAPLGPRVVRVILTGFQPIHFGFGAGRFGGARLFEAPVRWGLRGVPLREADLNPCPHPLA